MSKRMKTLAELIAAQLIENQLHGGAAVSIERRGGAVSIEQSGGAVSIERRGGADGRRAAALAGGHPHRLGARSTARATPRGGIARQASLPLCLRPVGVLGQIGGAK